MIMARHGQCVVITPFTLMGAMAPITLAGALVQQTAEALGIIALCQLVRPGAPCVMGGFTSNVDMRTGSPAFGTPEYVHAALATAQIGRRLRIPVRTSAVNASPAVDAQSTYETAFSLQAAILSHSHLINHAAGWLEGGLVGVAREDRGRRGDAARLGRDPASRSRSTTTTSPSTPSRASSRAATSSAPRTRSRATRRRSTGRCSPTGRTSRTGARPARSDATRRATDIWKRIARRVFAAAARCRGARGHRRLRQEALGRTRLRRAVIPPASRSSHDRRDHECPHVRRDPGGRGGVAFAAGADHGGRRRCRSTTCRTRRRNRSRRCGRVPTLAASSCAAIRWRCSWPGSCRSRRRYRALRGRRAGRSTGRISSCAKTRPTARSRTPSVVAPAGPSSTRIRVSMRSAITCCSYRTASRPTLYGEMVPNLVTARAILDAVREGRIDVGPLDAYWHLLIAKHNPALTAGVRVLDFDRGRDPAGVRHGGHRLRHRQSVRCARAFASASPHPGSANTRTRC